MMRNAFRIGLGIALGLSAVFAGAASVDAEGSGPLVAHMHEHYASVTQIQSAIIRGDLDAVREPAQWLAAHPAPTEMPDAWNPYLEAMRSAARAAVEATDFTAAATATSQMANACGNCHIANNISDQFPWQSKPEDEMGTLAHMQRHQWAADRMWEGLIGPSEDAWYQGTTLLLEVSLSAGNLDTEDDSAHSISSMASRVHELAANGKVEYEAVAKELVKMLYSTIDFKKEWPGSKR